MADLELALHRFGPALAYYGTAITALETSGTSLEKLAQATMIAVALLHLDRVEEAATAWAICELGYDELSWRPSGALNDGFMAIPARLGDALLAGGRRRGAEMGMEAGLVWVGGAARGDTGAR